MTIRISVDDFFMIIWTFVYFVLGILNLVNWAVTGIDIMTGYIQSQLISLAWYLLGYFVGAGIAYLFDRLIEFDFN